MSCSRVIFFCLPLNLVYCVVRERERMESVGVYFGGLLPQLARRCTSPLAALAS